MKSNSFSRCVLAVIIVLGAVFVQGCVSPLIRLQSPDADGNFEAAASAEQYDLIGDITTPQGMNIAVLEAVALVSGLDGTGSDPPPSSKRSMLMSEMQSHDVKNPNRLLGSPSTSMAIAYAYLRPGIRKGERFDVAVRVPARSATTSLEGGFLMQCRMREMAVLDNMIHTGLPIALARGDVLVDSLFVDGPDGQLQGRVLGGGVVLKNRPLGLAVRDGYHSVRTSALIGSALNSRFHTFDHGVKAGVATPKRDNYIELEVHPRYKHNVTRYMQVVRAVPIQRNDLTDTARLETLRRKLAEPTTAARAAIELEALGAAGVPVLLEGLGSPDPLVRFSAAESLAYLDQPQAAAALADAARDEIAFRWRALTALAAMDYVDAYDALIALLDVASAETRYGAFFALRTRNPYDPVVRGESLGDDAFSYHVINSSAEPMVHFTRSRRPELVTFGRSVALTPPPFLFAGKEILLKATEDGRIKASRFRPGQEDQHQLCDPDLDSVIRCVASMGAGYSDVMVMVHKAREEGYLKARVMVDAMPKSNRRYDHSQSTESSGETAAEAEQVPELFFNQIEADPESIEVMGAEFGDEELPPVVEENGDQGRSRPGFFGRITDWLAP